MKTIELRFEYPYFLYKQPQKLLRRIIDFSEGGNFYTIIPEKEGINTFPFKNNFVSTFLIRYSESRFPTVQHLLDYFNIDKERELGCEVIQIF